MIIEGKDPKERLHRLEALMPITGWLFIHFRLRFKVNSPIENNQGFLLFANALQLIYLAIILFAFLGVKSFFP